MKRILNITLLVLALTATACTQKQETTTDTAKAEVTKSGAFQIAFLTDVHLNRDNSLQRSQGMQKAVDHAKSKGVDLIIFGGDNADLDGLDKDRYQTADSLNTVFKRIAESSGLPTYYTIGNHDRYYFREDGSREDSGLELYKKHFGEVDYSFDHKGVHFVVINSVNRDAKHTYRITDEQKAWLTSDLSALSSGTPVFVITHVPLQSLYYPAVEGTIVPTDMVENFKEVWDILEGYNTIAVLQGHQHLHEELLSKGLWFLTGGAVCANWWRGPLFGTEEGYLLLTLDPTSESYDWDYVDYGWDAIAR